MFAQPDSKTWLSRLLICVLIATFGAVGCKPVVPAANNPNAGDHHAHEAHGPNGGHMVHLEPSGMHAEWAHKDDEGKLLVYVDDVIGAAKKIDGIRVELQVAGKSKKTYDLIANDKNIYELTSPELLTAIEVGADDAEKVNAALIITIEGKDETAEMEHHEHRH